uniref:LAB_N n=1 Tax=uncultured Chlamydia sp. TaxID=199738 RepID=A0A060BZB6_9CHLA|nr:LAB_N [uncultured Chlamydia sp.]
MIDKATAWLVVGLLGQAFFFMRFVVQWIASEKARKSIIPHAFWFFSIGGGIVLLVYAIYRRDPVFILGQAMGLVIYFRNIFFIRREKREALEAK